MKKILGLILALCLVLAVAVNAFAAKLAITKQPETATTNKKGTVSFAIKVSGSVNSITWYFVNPATGESHTGKKLPTDIKGVKVSNPNSKKITLKNVPESMHGWVVYCHINGNGYKLDSDKVMLLVYGLEPPAELPEIMSPAESSSESNEPAADSGEKEKSGDEGEGSSEPAETPVEPEVKVITVSCNAKALRKLDKSGTADEAAPSSSLDFGDASSGSFIVISEDPIKSYTINGVQIEPAEPVNEFRVLNVTDSVTLRLKINRVTAASAQVDESHMCKVTCKGCTFSYLRGGIRAVSEGEVPAGAPISVVADTAELAALGYSVNGAEPINQGLASFRLTVTDDVEIIAGN